MSILSLAGGIGAAYQGIKLIGSLSNLVSGAAAESGNDKSPASTRVERSSDTRVGRHVDTRA